WEFADQRAALTAVDEELGLPRAVVVHEIGGIGDVWDVRIVHKLQGVHLPWGLQGHCVALVGECERANCFCAVVNTACRGVDYVAPSESSGAGLHNSLGWWSCGPGLSRGFLGCCWGSLRTHQRRKREYREQSCRKCRE